MSVYPGKPLYTAKDYVPAQRYTVPDNVNRANRVRQLAQDISQIQSQLKADVEDARAHDAAAIEILNTIAHDAGYKTLDEYVDAAADQLSAEDKAAFDQMKTDLEHLDEDMNISHKVFRGLIAVGLLTKGIRKYFDLLLSITRKSQRFHARHFRHRFQANAINYLRPASRSEIHVSCCTWCVYRLSPASLY
jgi:uncharacterized membrane-anchored protein YhcB (DUF1043 family)